MTYSVSEVVLVFKLSSVLNDGFQMRQVGAHFEDLLHLRIVFDDKDVGFAVSGDILARLGRVRRVNSSSESAKHNTISITQ